MGFTALDRVENPVAPALTVKHPARELRAQAFDLETVEARESGCPLRPYSHFFHRKNRYGPIAARFISAIANG